jgi:DNA repair protein RadC
VLALLLGRSTRGDRLERARRILAAGGLAALGRGGVAALASEFSAGDRVRLAAALELGRRLAPGEPGTHPSVRGPRDVYEVTADLRTLRREHFVGLYLKTRNRLLARETISVGSLNASIVHPREVFEPALRLAAASLVVVHNHPSGETDPSEDDLAITRRLSEAGEILGIPLLDHVIVGALGFTSLKEGNYR